MISPSVDAIDGNSEALKPQVDVFQGLAETFSSATPLTLPEVPFGVHRARLSFYAEVALLTGMNFIIYHFIDTFYVLCVMEPIGAVGGSSIGGSGRDNLAGAIAGAVIGGLVGSALEANATKQVGMEYVVETSNGNLMTIVQGISPAFATGQKVLVLYGSPSRVVADPRMPK